MNAPASSFLDTNILVYAFDRSEPTKRVIAQALVQQLITARQAVLSVQVLAEFFVIVTRKITHPLTVATARRLINLLIQTCVVVTANSQTVLDAIDATSTHHLQFWDAMILVTARKYGCSVIYSEDFQHQRTIDGVQFINPFLS